LKFSKTLALLAVLYGLVRFVALFMGLVSPPDDWTDSMLGVLHAAGKLSKRARSNGDVAVPNARRLNDMEKEWTDEQA
jgi:hypothetical protein